MVYTCSHSQETLLTSHLYLCSRLIWIPRSHTLNLKYKENQMHKSTFIFLNHFFGSFNSLGETFEEIGIFKHSTKILPDEITTFFYHYLLKNECWLIKRMVHSSCHFRKPFYPRTKLVIGSTGIFYRLFNNFY